MEPYINISFSKIIILLFYQFISNFEPVQVETDKVNNL